MSFGNEHSGCVLSQEALLDRKDSSEDLQPPRPTNPMTFTHLAKVELGCQHLSASENFKL